LILSSIKSSAEGTEKLNGLNARENKLTYSWPEVGAQIKNFNAQVQIAQPKFLVVKTQAQIAQAKNKIVKAQVQIA